ncbi:hypothetical protein ACWIGW_44670 [Nocardia brasiliensis]
MIIPRAELPADNPEHVLASVEDPTDPTRVYVTGLKRVARGFAARFASAPMRGGRLGAVYRVAPVGELVPDDDFPERARCWSAERAQVVEVVTARVPASAKVVNEVLGPFMEWDDGTPVYDERGYMLPPPQMRAYGVIAADLVRFGRWVEYGEIAYFPAFGEVRWTRPDHAV